MGEEPLGSFVAKSKAGEVVTLLVFEDEVDIGTRGNPHATRGGLKSLRTADGGKVNRLGPRRYQVVESGELLTTDALDAP